ncbi:TAXI family TRAP transporter solute-binding subunit [Lentzea sp. NPDC042327]|uniref:TAXI family TRAP transporter solute-binding subunit n=1 Tax=Lentzea sp. NPDC042327 TaxID=3154801 RepID=UPI0033E7AC24
MLRRYAIGAIALALVVSGCGGKRTPTTPDAGSGSQASCEASDGRITIATGNSGGVYFVVGGGLAKLISDNSKLKASAAETGASVQNVQQLVGGTYDIAFSLADTAADAVNGTGAFTTKQKVSALARIYPNYTQVLVRADSGINSIADMKGKRISTGSPKSGTEVIAGRLLKSAGLNIDSDVSAQRLDLTKTADGMKDGSIDGLIWSGGLPTPQITDITTSMKDRVKFIDITPLLPEMKKISPVYDTAKIPAATYGVAEVSTIVVPNLLLVRDDFAANNACAVTKLIFDKKADLEKVHPAVKDVDRAKASASDPVPLHPGAKQALG